MGYRLGMWVEEVRGMCTYVWIWRYVIGVDTGVCLGVGYRCGCSARFKWHMGHMYGVCWGHLASGW